MTKLSPEEILRSIEETSIDDEMDRALSMTDEERRAELRAAGYDLDELHAQADALHKRIVDGRRPRRTTTVRVLTLLAATLGVLGVVVGVMPQVRDFLHPVNVAGRRKPTPADAMREKAFLACDAQRYNECLRLLDEARAMDPNGDRTSQVKEYRQKAETGLKNSSPAPSR